MSSPILILLSLLGYGGLGITDAASKFGPVSYVHFLFFHQVSLEYRGKHICGGSIISPYYIVTAGQCLNGKSPDLLTVRAAFLDSPDHGQVHQVQNFTVHEEYKKIQYGIPVNDIAVVRVKEPITETRLSKPIGIYRKTDPEIQAGAVAYVNSWGENINKSTIPELQISSMPIISNETCNSALKYFGGVPIGKICIPVGGKALCQSDEGSALTIRRRLAGIVSWTGRYCGDGFPEVYTRISDYSDWIEKKTKV
ncbi:hypothetical protein QAD02_023472 [Eretmocerus hayati]|uniref:Uncharacterized protein n=1 Tax=Eretmocerus hayati TaxID=131215 RepID=A0ACC2PX27_9HYME|nr:hypothetical protein QAD02_023472 [Eretmocerus hayati]